MGSTKTTRKVQNLSYNISDTHEYTWGVFEPLLDPSNKMVYKFIDDMMGELAIMFQDEYVHIGGDEVNPKQWIQSKNIKEFMERKNQSLGRGRALA